MRPENKVAIVTDTGSSVLPESELAKEFSVFSVPLDVKFLEGDRWVSYEDTDLTPDDFYAKMRRSEKLPQTSGAIPGKLFRLYDSLAKEERPIISIHITARHSTVWESAILGSKMAIEKNPHLLIEVVDSKHVSLATWFLVEQAARLSGEGYPLEDIKRITLETIPKINIVTYLSTFENVVKGGRLPPAAGFIGSNLHLMPIVSLVDGEIKIQGVARTNKSAQKELASRVENTKGLVKLAIVHTNFPEGAKLLKESLSLVYPKEIGIHEAGSSLGVHAGEKCLAIVTQIA